MSFFMTQSILNMPTPLHMHLSFFNSKAAIGLSLTSLIGGNVFPLIKKYQRDLI